MSEHYSPQVDAQRQMPMKSGVNRRKAIVGAFSLAIVQAGDKVRNALQSEKQPTPEKPTLTIEFLEKKFKLNSEELGLVKTLSEDLHLEDIYRILDLDENDRVVKDENERREWLKINPLLGVSGMEHLGLKSEDIREVAITRFPKGLFYMLHKVVYVDEEIPMPEAYGRNLRGSEGAHVETFTGEIVISKGHKSNLQPHDILNTMRHEAGHFMSPLRNRLLTRQERLQLKQALVDRLKTKVEDHFFSDYVDNISNTDKKAETNYKSEEYLAEIVSFYLSQHLSSHWKPPDAKIVAELIQKMHPGFDVKKMSDFESAKLSEWSKSYFQRKH